MMSKKNKAGVNSTNSKEQRTKRPPTLEEWLFSFVRMTGGAVVVSLLVDREGFAFLSCVNRVEHLSGQRPIENQQVKTAKQAGSPPSYMG